MSCQGCAQHNHKGMLAINKHPSDLNPICFKNEIIWLKKKKNVIFGAHGSNGNLLHILQAVNTLLVKSNIFEAQHDYVVTTTAFNVTCSSHWSELSELKRGGKWPGSAHLTCDIIANTCIYRDTSCQYGCGELSLGMCCERKQCVTIK